MIKIVIAGIAAFVLALGGGTGVAMWRAKQAAAHAAAANEKHPAAVAAAPASDSTHAAASADSGHAKADSTPVVAAAAAPAADSAKPGAAKAADGKHEVAAATPKGEGAATAAKAAALAPRASVVNVRPAGTPPAPKGASDSAQRALGFKQLAKIFGSMKPTDATKVMALMTDDEVDGVLRQFQPRQAADLLANFPKERAAALSRRLLQPRGA